MSLRTEFWKHCNLLILTWQLHSELFLHTCELCAFSRWTMSNGEETEFFHMPPKEHKLQEDNSEICFLLEVSCCFLFICEEKTLCIYGPLGLHIAIFSYRHASDLIIMFSTVPEESGHTSQWVRAYFPCMELHTLLRMAFVSVFVSLDNTLCTQILCKYVFQTILAKHGFFLYFYISIHFSLPKIPYFSWYTNGKTLAQPVLTKWWNCG